MLLLVAFPDRQYGAVASRPRLTQTEVTYVRERVRGTKRKYVISSKHVSKLRTFRFFFLQLAFWFGLS